MGKPSLCDMEDCTGCFACAQKCPFDAIGIIVSNGFSFPCIDSVKCRECGICEQTCPVLNKEGRVGNKHTSVDYVYAAYSNDSVRMSSSSGGAFTVMAEKVLADDGIVFGAAWSDSMSLHHIGVTKLEELDRIRRSKYVQSDTGNTFRQVKSELKAGRKVLYCGTPCQIAGLTNYLKNVNLDNLITIDLICQGVPSPVLFRKYLDEIENETGMITVDANFRTKEKGWRCGLLLLLLLRGRDIHGKEKIFKRTKKNNSFYNSFMKGYFMRESCYNCKFKRQSQGYYSDITIGDFWRIGTDIPIKVRNYEKGISAVICNTDKGKTFWGSCKDAINMIKRSYAEFETNGGLYVEKKPGNNNDAFEYLTTHTWKETQDKYFPLSFRQKLSMTFWLLFGEKNIKKIKYFLGR